MIIQSGMDRYYVLFTKSLERERENESRPRMVMSA